MPNWVLITARPYVGIVFVWDKNFSSCIQPAGNDVASRYCAIQVSTQN